MGQRRDSYGGALDKGAMEVEGSSNAREESVGITNAKEKKITKKCICESGSRQCAGTNAVIGQRTTWGFIPRFLRAPSRPIAG